jgi:hypothetical protein
MIYFSLEETCNFIFLLNQHPVECNSWSVPVLRLRIKTSIQYYVRMVCCASKKIGSRPLTHFWLCWVFLLLYTSRPSLYLWSTFWGSNSHSSRSTVDIDCRNCETHFETNQNEAKFVRWLGGRHWYMCSDGNTLTWSWDNPTTKSHHLQENWSSWGLHAKSNKA